MATKKAPAGEPTPLACDKCHTERRNLVCHLTPQGDLLQLCPACMSRWFL